MKNWVLNIIIAIFCLSIIGVIIVFATMSLTANETTLISVLLTIISIIATWIVSQYFARVGQKAAIEEVKREHINNLRTYALNAAEKVDNLSNELTKLAVYMAEELDKDETSHDEMLLSRTERLESAIHIVKTLKSVNDTSLSDWKGVIGEELEERQEEKEDRENRMLLLTERIDELINSNNESAKDDTSQAEIRELKTQLNLLLGSMNIPYQKRRVLTKPTKEKVGLTCPHCKSKINYQQRRNPNSFKTVRCSDCENRYLARYSEEKGFFLQKEELIKETFECPWCSEENSTLFSNLPFIKEIIKCKTCKNQMKLTRGIHEKLSVKTYGNSTEKEDTPLSPELFDKIEKELPPQPWETGIHKKIAEKLGVPNKTISVGIQTLINKGKFYPQIDGIIYKPEKPDNKNEE